METTNQTIRQELNDEIARKMVVEVNSLAQWLSLYDARRQSDVNTVLIDALTVLEHQCTFTRDKLVFHQNNNQQ